MGRRVTRGDVVAGDAAAGEVPVVGPREPCPCGSGRRYKACHGRATAAAPAVLRPFAGRVDEPEWVALREVVPAATAPLRLAGEPDRPVVLATVLPMAWAAIARADGTILVGLQVPARSGDVSRDVAAAIEAALAAPPGTPLAATGAPGPGPRLQDLLDPAPIEVTVHDGFEFWVGDAADSTGEVGAALEKANRSIVPTARLASVTAAYWASIGDSVHLRWVLPDDEEPTLDAFARLAVRGALPVVPGSRFVGSFRAHGLLVPVWDLPDGTTAEALEEPALTWRQRLDEELARPRTLTAEERRARAGLLNRQVTLR